MKEIIATERSLKIIDESFQKMAQREKKRSLQILSTDSAALYSMLNFERFKNYVCEYLLENKCRDILKLSVNEIFEKSKSLLQFYETKIKLLTEDSYHPITEFATIEDQINYLEDYISTDNIPYKSYAVESLNEYCNSIFLFLSTVIFVEKESDPNNDNLENSLQNYEGENLFCSSMPIKKAVEHFSKFEELNKNKKPFLTKEQLDLFIRKAFYKQPDIQKQRFNYNSDRENGLIISHFHKFYSLALNEDFENSSQCRDKYIKLLCDNFTNWDFEKVKQNFSKKYKSSLTAT